MQPKDRPNGWAFLETSLPLSSSPVQGFSLTHCLYFASYHLLPRPLLLSLSLLRLPTLPLFHFPAPKEALPALQAGGAWIWFLAPASLPPGADRPSPRLLGKEKAELWCVWGGIFEHLARPSPQVSGRLGHSRTDQGAYPGAPVPTGARPGSRSPGTGGRGAGQTSCAPHPLSLPSFSPALASAGVALPPAKAWGRVGRSCGAGQEVGLYLREGNPLSP